MSIVITHAVRTPIGKYRGVFAHKTAIDVGAAALHALKQEIRQPHSVLMGNVLQAGLGQNPARRAALRAGFPVSTRCVTINKVCGSSLEAIAIARNMVATQHGRAIIVAGGMESMTNSPSLYNKLRTGLRIQENEGEEIDSMIHDGLWDCTYRKHMGLLADKWWRQYGITRKELDAYAYESHMRAVAAQKKGVFDDELIPVDGVTTDEGPRPDTTLKKLASLKPSFKKLGANTAGNSSMISDGAAAVAIMDDITAEREGFTQLAEIIGYSSVGVDPKNYGLAPITAVQELLQQHELQLEDIDLIELNEAFATQSIVVMRELDLDAKKTNIYGVAIALGHPLGATGARIVTTLVHALQREKKDYGIATLCIGGGEGSALLIRRIPT